MIRQLKKLFGIITEEKIEENWGIYFPCVGDRDKVLVRSTYLVIFGKKLKLKEEIYYITEDG